MEPPKPGAEGTASVRVDPSRTANALGNRGVNVFATPFLAALMEEACRNAVEPLLPPGSVTLGGFLELKHLAPTPLGFRVEARARLVETKGPKFVFEIEVRDDLEKVAEGRHARVVVKEEDFRARVEAKAGKKGSS
ncbi:MAG: hypothetical protein MUC63_01215 [Planctomycetes bacterium]|nr:hypothetical protein [Planctomycetota bacterium]